MVLHNHNLIRIPGWVCTKILPVPENTPDSFMKAQPRSVPRVGLRPQKLNRPYLFSPKATVELGHMETGHIASVCSMQLEGQPCGAAVELMEGWFPRMSVTAASKMVNIRSLSFSLVLLFLHIYLSANYFIS